MLLGAHESIAGGLAKAVYRGQQATCEVVQIFNKASNQWQARPLTDEEVEAFLAAIEETGIAVPCSHTGYLINIASPHRGLRERSCRALGEELERCRQLQIPYLVHHPGSHVGAGPEAGVAWAVDSINRLFAALPDNRVTLCLESTAGQGSALGHTFEELAAIIDSIEDQSRIGVCLDTCHLFAAGYPLSSPEEYHRTMAEFDQILGLDRLKIFHLNDSRNGFGSRRDRHEHLGQGEIGLEGFRALVNDPRLKVPLVLETPKGDDVDDPTYDRENLRVLRSLVKKGSEKKVAVRKGR